MRLAYLLKLAQSRPMDGYGPALDRYGIDARELAVLAALTGDDPAVPAGARGPVAHRPHDDGRAHRPAGREGAGPPPTHPGDRRKNIVVLTAAGRSTQRRTAPAVDEVERQFLAPLPAGEIQRLRNALRTLIE